MKNILVISPDLIGKLMAGPGIRYWNIAKELSKCFKVVLLVPNDINDTKELLNNEEIEIDMISKRKIDMYLKSADVVITQGIIINKFSQLRKKKVPLVVDLYDPFILENLELRKNNGNLNKQFRYSIDLSILIEQIKYGDFFLCASEKQKDYWMGFFSAMRKINPTSYDFLIKSEDFISVVPFGIEKASIESDGKNIRKKYSIKDSDTLLVWAGGIWEWMDPITLIKAIDMIKDKGVKCLFMGTKRPNQFIDYTPKVKEVINLSNELNLTNKNIFFEDWVPFKEREEYLMASDIGVTTYFKNLEGEYSFRTRILDYIWSNKPFIITKGDYFADIAEKNKIGLTVEEKDPNDLADKILYLKDNKELYNNCKYQLNILKESFYWENGIKPLVKFCRNPYKINGKTLISDKVNIYSFIKRQIEKIKSIIMRFR